MSMQINNSVNNINNTPGIIADIYANIPTANNVAIGTIFIATDTNTIYRSDGAAWQTLGGGGGGSSTLNQVLAAGNNATNGINLIITASDGSTYSIVSDVAGYGAFIAANVDYSKYSVITTDTIAIIDIGKGRQINLLADFIAYRDFVALKNAYLKCLSFNEQDNYLAEDTGTLALQDPPYIIDINTASYTPTVIKESIYTVSSGAATIVLDPNKWKTRVRACFLVDQTFLFTSALANISGNANINQTGLVYVIYLEDTNTFYLSHT